MEKKITQKFEIRMFSSHYSLNARECFNSCLLFKKMQKQVWRMCEVLPFLQALSDFDEKRFQL